jgi:aminomethyltransferase
MDKQTVFFEKHTALNAKIIPFAGFNMPVEYSGVTDENLTVRNGVGVFDVSHMGEIIVEGEKSLDFLQFVTTNDVSKLSPGMAQYTCFPNGKGGIVDDLLIYHLAENKYLLVVNAANIEKDYNWIVSQNSFGVTIINKSDDYAQLAIQGPKALDTLQKLTSVNLTDIKFYTFTVDEFAGVKDVIISATGYTGAGGFELYFENKDASVIWDKIFEAGEEFGIKPIGLAARDTLRLEMGYCLYGNDIDDTTSPLEAGLGWIVKLKDKEQFIDSDFYKNQKAEGITKKLVGLKMQEKGIPRHGYEIVDEDGNLIGEVTSGTMSPVLKQGIAMGYIKKELASAGNIVYVKIRNKVLKASVEKFPFV